MHDNILFVRADQDSEKENIIVALCYRVPGRQTPVFSTTGKEIIVHAGSLVDPSRVRSSADWPHARVSAVFKPAEHDDDEEEYTNYS